MAFTKYTKDTTIIGALGTNPAERALTTQEFKDKFDQFADEFVAWFNETHLPEVAEKAVVDEHKADNANKAHGGFKGALVSLSVQQSIPNNTTTLISWGVENYDDLNIWSSDNPTKLVVPNGISKVIVKAGVFWAVSSAGYRSVQILKNGAGFAGMGSDQRNAVERSGVNFATSVITVSPGDYFELQVTQNSGGSLDLVALSQTWFSMEVIE